MTKLHFVGLPHTQLNKKYEFCAYSMKLLHMGQICKLIGYDTVLYGSANDEGEFGEVVEIITDADREEWFGHIDWDVEVFSGWDVNDKWWMASNERAIEEIKKRIEPGDIICLIAGRCQQPIISAFPNNISVEWAVGYEGIIPELHHAYESLSWQHHLYGKYGIDDGRFYDVVIPNSFNSKDFIMRADKEDYILFISRLIPRKGTAIVEEIAKSCRVLVAGQGDLRIPGTEYVGIIRGQEKAELLARAKALICPTLYIEPFGGVAVEAQLSGTPAISTDFGAFPETIIHGETGFRCRTLREFLDAADRVGELNPWAIKQRAERLYSLEGVSLHWKRWFDQLQNLYGAGWYS